MNKNNNLNLEQPVQFSFFRVPKELFTSQKYKKVSAEAKLLYALLHDRTSLSAKNNWEDENGQVFIYFTIESVMEYMGCGHDKAGKLFSELENADLIERRRQGQGKPFKIYVKNFISDVYKSDVKKCEKPKSEHRNSRDQDIGKTACSNTEINNTEISYTNLSIKTDAIDEIDSKIKENISYEIIIEQQPNNKTRIDELVGIMTDAICSTKNTVRISGNDIPKDDVKSRLLTIDEDHISYVLDCVDRNYGEIRNIKAYLLSSLFNAPTTMDSYYTAMVNRDFYGGKAV